MIRHVVVFRLAESAPAGTAARIVAALRTLPATIPEIRRYELGPDLGINAGNFDVAVVADFDDEAGYLAYRDHPEHQRIIAELIRPAIAERAAVQYEI